MDEDVGSIDCPDCQLQLLQQTQSQNPPTSPDLQDSLTLTSSTTTNQATVLHEDNSLVGGRPPLVPTEIGFPLITKSTPYSQVDNPNQHHHSYQLSTIQNIRAPSSSGGLNAYHYATDYGSLSVNPSISTSNSSTTMHQGTFSTNPSSSSIPPHHGTDLNYGGSGVMEPCDYHGYCSTCAVLDIPSNDKYYHRPTNPRPHVFPPIFYSQGPSSVIPGFSSIGDWTNGEYGHHYAYSATFSQTASSVGPSMTSDVYGSSSVPSHQNNGNNSQHGTTAGDHHVPLSSSSSFDMFSSNNPTSSMLQSSFPNQRHHIQPSTSMFMTSSGSNSSTSRTTDYSASHPHFSHHIATSATPQTTETLTSNKTSQIIGSTTNDEKTAGQGPKPDVVPCSNNPTASSSNTTTTSTIIVPSDVYKSQQQSGYSESSCDSDSDSSIASEDRELISVVEEDDDEDEMESTKGVRPGGKCFVCHNPIEITDCSSPQLAKILENIEDDIAVEDLDISGDIEIGGIEDYQGYKKRHTSSGVGHPSGFLSTSRLTILLGLSAKNLFGLEAGTSGGIDHHDVAILCFKCGKLASMADNLERQLASTIQTLQQLMTNNCMDSSPRPPSLNLTMGKSMPMEEYHHHSIPSISPTLQFHHMPRPVHHKGVQTDVERRSWGTQIPSSPCPTPIDVHHESLDAMTQCYSYDFPNLFSFEEASTNQSEISNPSISSSNNGESSSDDTHSDSDETHFNILSKHDTSEHGSNSFSNNNEMVETPLPEPAPPHSSHPTSTVDIILPQDPFLENSNSFGKQSSDEPQVQTSNDSIICAANITEFTKSNDDPINENGKSVAIFDSFQSQVNLSNVCESCQRVFSTKSNLRAHQKICNARLDREESGFKRVMKCPKCGIGFRNVLRQRVHMEQGCKAFNFECDHCPRKFVKSSELKAHLNCHKGEKPFSCEKCGASFATKGNQISHSKTHLDNKRFYCSQCDKGFNRRFALTVHLNRHNDIKPFPCSLCSKSFPDPSYLTKHKKKAHVLITT